MLARADSDPIQEEQHSIDLTVKDAQRISYTFPCPKCLEFWKNLNSSTSPGFDRSIHCIEEHLKCYNLFNENNWKKIWKIIKRLLLEDFDSAQRRNVDSVSVRQIISLIKHFGCICCFKIDGENTCFFLSQIEQLMKNSIVIRDGTKMSWFAGHMSKQKADEKLKDQPVETFLVRFSQTEMMDGGFAAAIKTEDGVRHYIIASQPCCPRATDDNDDEDDIAYDGKFHLVVNNRHESRTFMNLVEFVSKRLRQGVVEGVRCGHVCPGLPFNADFSGYR